MRRPAFRPAHVRAVLRHVAEHARACPCHACAGGAPAPVLRRGAASAPASTDYAFEMAASTVRFGRGVTRELGFDLEALGARSVLLVTDAGVRKTPAFSAALGAIEASRIRVDVFDRAAVEPTDASLADAIAVARAGQYDAYVAVGGGSAIDTAKAANLYATHAEADFLDFVNAPIGRGLPVPGPVRPLVALPTTAGTGSETTGVAIFDHEPTRAKTGIGSRLLRPALGLIDPDSMATMPREVAVASGLDVLCHALESYTALPYDQRAPRPARPELRPAYQGSNPISDVWALSSLRAIAASFERAVAGEPAAQEAMAVAATCAGVGFGNAGVHLPHGMSYPISGLNKHLAHVRHTHGGYDVGGPIIPHGISVAVPAPAVFRMTGPASPERHLAAAEALGADVSRCASDDGEHAGALLAERVLRLMQALRVPLGLRALGFTQEDVPALVQGTLPQERVTKLAPRPQPVTREALECLFTDAMAY